MMEIPRVKVVYDRKNKATKTKRGLIQIEVSYRKVRKYYSTDVKVFPDQWSERHWVINCLDSAKYNKWLHDYVASLEEWIHEHFVVGEEKFVWDKLTKHIKNNELDDNFIDFVRDSVETRQDIRKTTRRAHRKLVTSLERFGCMTYFSDVTKRNVIAYEKWLQTNGIKQVTVYSYIKLLKTYVHLAMNMEYVTKDPFAGLHFKKGEETHDKFLVEDEMRAIESVRLPSDGLCRARDLFMLQCYTGLAYEDIVTVDFKRAVRRNGKMILTGRRIKTGESYYIILLREAQEILERYEYRQPVICNQKYNIYLKAIAVCAGVDKPISSHWGRRSCGYYLLNNGVPIEIVAKFLGHSSIKTTEKAYARVLDSTAERAFDLFFK